MSRLRFGAFLAPHHPVGEHPRLQFRRDLDLVEMLDKADVALELQHRVLPDGMMRGEEGAEAKAGHSVYGSRWFLQGLRTQGRRQRGLERSARPGDHERMMQPANTMIGPKIPDKPTSCAKAIRDFRDASGITDPIMEIDGIGSFWRRG